MVMAEQHRDHTDPNPTLVRLYLRFEGMPFLEVGGTSHGHGVRITEKGPPEPYDMEDYGRVTVDDLIKEAPFASCVGQTLKRVMELGGAPIGQAGFRFEFGARSFSVVNVWDELDVAGGLPAALKHLHDITERVVA